MTRATAVLVVALAGCAPAFDPADLVFALDDAEYWQDDGALDARRRILVTNNFDDTVSVLDLDRAEDGELVVLATVPVGLVPVEREGPHHVAAAPDGAHYFVAISNFVPAAGSGPHGVHGGGTADGHALKVRAADDVTVAATRVDRSPGDIRTTPDGSLLLVTHFDILKITEAFAGGDVEDVDASLSILDPETMTELASFVVCPGMHGVSFSPDGATAYISCVSDEMAIVDLRERALVRRVTVLDDPGSVQAPVCYPYATAASPDGASVWVSCSESGELLRYDVASGEMDPLGVVQLNGPAVFGAFLDDGARFVVPFQGSTSEGLAIVDPAIADVVQVKMLFPPECQNPHAVRPIDGEQKLLVVCEGDHAAPGTVIVVDLASEDLDVLDAVDVGRYPDDLALLEVP
jgi:DNA-binding beta-propeller fold protein YncE